MTTELGVRKACGWMVGVVVMRVMVIGWCDGNEGGGVGGGGRCDGDGVGDACVSE